MSNYTMSDIYYIIHNSNLGVEQLCHDTGLSKEEVEEIIELFKDTDKNKIQLSINISMKKDGKIETNFLFDKESYTSVVQACEHLGEFLYMIVSGALVSDIFNDIVASFDQEKSEKIIEGFVSASEIDNKNLGKPVVDTAAPITFGNAEANDVG